MPLAMRPELRTLFFLMLEPPCKSFRKLSRFSPLNCARYFVCALCIVAWAAIATGQMAARTGAARNAADYPGLSIVEKIQAAIRDCANAPCAVYIPGGTYDASPISTWKNVDFSGARAGVLLPSNVEIRGAGKGITTIRVKRAASDPPATLFANTSANASAARADANSGSHNISLRHISLTWADSSSSYDWVSIFICHACDHVEFDHVSLEGNPNKLANLLDNTHLDIHDSSFLLHSTGYGHGDNALGVSHFDPAQSPGNEAGVIRDNVFAETGNYRSFSMLIVAQSGLYVQDNRFEAHLPPPGHATAIESGQDNTARLPENVKISGNIFHGASIAYGGLNHSEISGNFFDHGDIYVALQSGSTASLSGLTIADNELHFGTISIGGLEHTLTSQVLIARNRLTDGGIGTGNSLTVRDVQVIDNTVSYSQKRPGIDCNACSMIRGNVVRDIGQNAPGDLHPGYLIGGTVEDVSGNLYMDDQHEYDSGTLCSVADPAHPACLTSGESRWILLRGGEWGFGWTNRTLFTTQGNLLIHAFVNSSLLELEESVSALKAGTKYQLYRTTYNAFELNSATIGRFANNMATSSTGPFRHAAVQEDGNVVIWNLSGNFFYPYSCDGKCQASYNTGAPR